MARDEFSSFGNPALTEDSFNVSGAGRMSRAGVVFWLVFLLAIMITTGGFVMSKAMIAFDGFDFNLIQKVDTGQKDSDGDAIYKRVVIDPETKAESPLPDFQSSKEFQLVNQLMWVGLLGGLVVGLVCVFNKPLAPFLAPIYAALEGFALGGVSAMYELEFGGIVMQAAILSVAVLIAMLAIYATGMIRVTSGFMVGILAMMLAVLGVYVVDIVLGLTGNETLSIIHSNSWAAIAFSGFVCVLAAFNFFIDFDTIERGVESGAPAYMNAYCAFGILLTLVWLYLEILRLLAKLKSRD